MPKRNSPKDVKELDDLNRLNDLVFDKRIDKRAAEKKTRRDRHYQKQFIKNNLNLNTSNNNFMSQIEIIAKLKNIVKPYVKNQVAFDNLNENTDFINDLQINSANLVDVILDVEEIFKINITNQEMEKMLTVQATLEIIEAKLLE